MALTDRSVPLDYPPLKEEPRLALVMGTEGDGLYRFRRCKAGHTHPPSRRSRRRKRKRFRRSFMRAQQLFLLIS